MKKYIILIFIASVLFSACNPNKEIYDNLDAKYDVPYSETGINYTITSDDYKSASKEALKEATNKEDSTWADYVKSYTSFNDKYPINGKVTPILSNSFPALKDGSKIVVSYNHYIGALYNVESSEMGNSDYRAIIDTVFVDADGDGEIDTITVADNISFSQYHNPHKHLPGYLLNKYPNAVEGDYNLVRYRYPTKYITTGSPYVFDGTVWKLDKNVRLLQNADFTAMGLDPSVSAFNPNIDPNFYLPKFLKIEYPYAKAGDEKVLMSKFGGYEKSIYLINCKYDGSEWAVNFPGEARSAQYVYVDNEWKFDPTVSFTMAKDDYQIIASNDPNPDSHGTGGYYYGATSYYSNFDIRLTKRRTTMPDMLPATMSDDEANVILYNNVREGIVVLLENKFPDAVPTVEGIDVHYIVVFDTFDDTYSHTIYSIEYKCTAAGSPATFEMVTDMEEVK